MSESVDNYLFLAKIAEKAECYDTMVDYIKKVLQVSPKLTVEGRNLLSVAYKNIVGSRRNSLRVLQVVQMKRTEKGQSEEYSIVSSYISQVETELENFCHEIIDLIDKVILPEYETRGEPNPSEGITAIDFCVFFYKMKGDYYRYLAEFQTGAKKSESADKASSSYATATTIAAGLPATNAIRLGLALNYSVFQYEIAEQPSKAIMLAKTAFDEGVAQLDRLSDDSYRDSTLIIQLLRDNLKLWNTPVDGQED